MNSSRLNFKGILYKIEDLPGIAKNNIVGDSYIVNTGVFSEAFIWEGEYWSPIGKSDDFQKSNLETLVDYKKAIDLEELVVPIPAADTTVHSETIEDIIERDNFAKEHKLFIDEFRKSATNIAVDKLLRNGHYGKHGKTMDVPVLSTVPVSDVKVIDLDIAEFESSKPTSDSQASLSDLSPIKNTSGLFHLKDPSTGALVSGGLYPQLQKRIGFRLVDDINRDRIYGRGYLFTGIVIRLNTLIRMAPLEPDMNRWRSMYPPSPPMVTVKDIAYYWYIEDGK